MDKMTKEKLPTMGNKKADVLVVCDPPSAWLWQKGLPIGGDAIKLFGRIAEECGFLKDDFYFISPCPPIPEEIESSDKRITDFVNPYREQVLSTIRRVDPAVIVYLGKWAGRIVMGRPQQIMKVRGSFTDTDIPELGRVPVMPMLSPGHVLRRPEMSDIFRTDFYMLERLRDLDWDAKRIVETAAGKKDYRWCTDLSELTKLNPKHISVDTETTGLTWHTAGTDDPDAVKILTVQIGYAPGKAICVPVDCAYYPDLTPRKREKLLGQLKALLEDPAIKKAGHNIKYDTHVLREDLGIYIDYATDTQLLAFVVDENMQEKSLDECVRRWVPALAGYNDELNKKLDKSNMRGVSHDDMLQYGCGDADATYRLAVALTQLAKADKKQWRCYQKIILPAIKAFCDPVEFYGIRVNTKVLSQLQKDLHVTEREVYANLIEQVPPAIKRKHAEKGLKFTRDAFTRDILFSRQGLKLIPKVFTKSTAKLPPDQRIPSVSTKQHLPYFQDEPFVAQLMEYIKLQKMRSTYVGVPFDEEKGGPTGFWQYIYNGEIHPSFMLHRVVTGRTSSVAPNCFPGYVEVLTDRGWYRFDSVPDSLKVAQYDFGTGYIDFAKPDGFIERSLDNGFLREIKTAQHIDIVCTEDHRFTLKNRKTGAWKEVTAVNYSRDALQPHSGFHHSGTLHYTPAQVTLICALQADAHIMRDGGHLDWAFRKARKAERLEAALIEERIPYRIHSKGGRFRFYVSRKNIPDYLRDKKQFGQWVLDLTAPSLHCFCNELMFWDGDYTRGMAWTTINKTDADWVQLAYTLSGKRACITQRQNNTCREFYVVNVTDKAYSYTANHTNERIPYSGKVYCFSMPKDSLVVRHNGRVHIVNNSQNFPKRGKLAKTYRKIFQARPGYVFMESDISQAELRIAAWMANEKTMLKIYREGGDIHAMTAAGTLGISVKTFKSWEDNKNPVRDLGDIPGVDDLIQREGKGATIGQFFEFKRYQAKAQGFGFLYGMGWRKFKTYAKTDYGLDFTDQQAEQLREAFFALYPGLVDWHESTRAWVRKKGYVRALHGAIRHLPSINSSEEYIRQECERQAVNAPVQRFASDLGLVAMIRLTRDANPEDIRPLMFVHDALVVEVREEYADEAMGWIKFYMESPPLKQWFNLNPPVPIVTDLARGYNLGEMEKCKGVKAVAPDWYMPEHDDN